MTHSRADRDASFAVFMDRAGPALLRTAWFLTADADRTQELTQTALVKAYLAWPRIDHDEALPYARRYLVNHKIDIGPATRELADVTATGPEPGAGSQSGSLSDDEVAIDRRDDLVCRLSRLPEQQRKIVVLRYYAGQSEGTVADVLGTSVGAVRNAASLGLDSLRQPDQNAAADPGLYSSTEGDLRRELDAAGMPSNLNFRPESVLREGRGIIRRRRNVTACAVLAIALVAGGVTLATRAQDTAIPPTKTRAATSAIVRADLAVSSGSARMLTVELNGDPKVTANVRLLVVEENGRRREVVAWSTGRRGQKPDATWKSGMVDGHPFTVGLIPGTPMSIRSADHGFNGYATTPMTGTIYTAFAADYTSYPIGSGPTSVGTEAARPATITSISWSGPTGIVDGIEGGHRLTGQVLTFDRSESVNVILRPGTRGRSTVYGSATSLGDGNSTSRDLSVETTDPSGAAVVTARQPRFLRFTKTGRPITTTTKEPPVAAGVLPVGASDIGVILTTGEVASGLPLSVRLPDGRVIFAIKAEGAQTSSPGKDSIKAVTWTNADGSPGRKSVTQHEEA